MNKRNLHSFLRLFTVGLLFVSFSQGAKAQTAEIIVNASSSQNIVTGNLAYHVSEAIYLSTEIGATNFRNAATAINRIEISVAAPLGTPTSFGNFNIYLKEVDDTTLAAGSYNKTGYTQVFTGSIDITAAGWFGINLTTPFVRTNGTNLQIMFERLDGVARTAPFTYYASVGTTTSSAAVTTRRYNGATAPVVGTTSLTTSAFRPFIGLFMAMPRMLNYITFYCLQPSCFATNQNVNVVIKNVGFPLQ